MTEQPLKIGIIGFGAIGQTHFKAFSSLTGAKITAVCDADTEKLAGLPAQYKTFSNYLEFLKSDIDAVCVCVGNSLHRDVAVAALAADKHVLLEKPMAINLLQADDIAVAARKSQRVTQIGMVLRQHPSMQILQKYIDDGILGEIYHVNLSLIRRRGIPGLGKWFTTKAQSGGGPLIDLGVHWFDLSMWLSGMWKPLTVCASTYSKFGNLMQDYNYIDMWAGPPNYNGKFDVEDFATGFVKFDGERTLSFEVAWAANIPDRNRLEIFGTRGGVRLENLEDLKIYTDIAGKQADIVPQYAKESDMFFTQAERFVSACKGLCEPAVCVYEGLAVMTLIDEIYKDSQK